MKYLIEYINESMKYIDVVFTVLLINPVAGSVVVLIFVYFNSMLLSECQHCI